LYDVAQALGQDYEHFDFGLATRLTSIAGWCVGVPEVVIVGISYGMESYDQWVQAS
jgi:hypothetical protein